MDNVYYSLSIAWKEMLVFIRDRGALAMLLLFPTLLSSVQGGANLMLAGEEDSPSILLQVGMVNLDSGVFGSEVSKSIQNIDIFIF